MRFNVSPYPFYSDSTTAYTTAKQGNTVARNNLGFLYIFGLGVEEDFKISKDLFTTDNTECEILNNFVLGRVIKDPNGNEEAVDFFSLPRK